MVQSEALGNVTLSIKSVMGVVIQEMVQSESSGNVTLSIKSVKWVWSYSKWSNQRPQVM